MNEEELTALLDEKEFFPALSASGIPFFTMDGSCETIITVRELLDLVEEKKYTIDPETLNINLQPASE